MAFLGTATAQTTLNFDAIPLTDVYVLENEMASKSKGRHYFNPFHDDDIYDLYALDQVPNVKKKAIIYERTNGTFFPPMHSWYFYTEDSVARWMFYNWGFANPGVEASNKTLLEQNERKKEYIEKYELEKQHMVERFGLPTSDTTKLDTDGGITKKAMWDLEDKRIIVEMNYDAQSITIQSNKWTSIIPTTYVRIVVLVKKVEE